MNIVEIIINEYKNTIKLIPSYYYMCVASETFNHLYYKKNIDVIKNLAIQFLNENNIKTFYIKTDNFLHAEHGILFRIVPELVYNEKYDNLNTEIRLNFLNWLIEKNIKIEDLNLIQTEKENLSI